MSFLDLSPALLIPLIIFGSAAVLLLALYLAKPKPFLDGTRQSLKLQEIKVLSPDTKLFRFALPSDKHCFGLPLGKHVKIFTFRDVLLVLDECGENLLDVDRLLAERRVRQPRPEGPHLARWLWECLPNAPSY